MWNEIAEAVILGDSDRASRLIQQALASGAPPEEILEKGLIAGMNVVGQRFRDYEMFLPEVIQSAQAMQAGLNVLKPALAGANAPTRGKVVIGTVQGDIHDIGKNLVCVFLEGAGFEVIDLGVDVPPERFVEAVKRESPRIVALSSLLTSTMPAMRRTIQALSEAGFRDRVRVLVGGAPVTQAYADAIGADGYAPDAASGAAKAVQLASSL
jgi:5-methyltetrahydrofolate--homocysteine methyltransferase